MSGSEIIAVDLERVRVLGAACADASSAAGRLAHDVSSLLGLAQQRSRSAALLSELEQELALLRSVILESADQLERADRWTLSNWLDPGGRISALLYEKALWASLNDSVGATAIDTGVFDLAVSFRSMGEAEWRSATIPPGCGSFGQGRYYTGGGAIDGPDHRIYPITVPHVVLDDEHHYTIDGDIDDVTPSVASLGGADPGWAMVGYRTGIERISSEPGRGWKALAGLAVASGLDVALGVDDANLAGVHLRAGSPARFAQATIGFGSAQPAVATGGSALTDPESTVWLMIDGRVGEYPASAISDLRLPSAQPGTVPHSEQTRLGRVNTADQLLSLATGAANGYVAWRDLDNGRQRAYEVIFEENADGRRRARVQTFTLENGPAGVALYGWHLFLDADGDLRQSPVSYRSQAVVLPDDVVLAHNPLDPDFSQRVAGQSFGATTD